MTPEQLRMARAALRIGTRELAKEVGISFMTISRFETGKGDMQHGNAEKLRVTLEGMGVTFLNDTDVSVGTGVSFKAQE